MDRLRKRSEFLAVAKGRRVNRAAFTIQARPRSGASEGPGLDATLPSRFGITVTRQLGSSPARNRVRRRLRDAVRRSKAAADLVGFDIVVVARETARTQAFADLVADLTAALAEIGRRGGRGQANRGKAAAAVPGGGAGRTAPPQPAGAPAPPGTD